MREAIWVSDGGTINGARDAKRRQVDAYLYAGWEYDGWGSAPKDCALHGTRYGLGWFYSRETPGPDWDGFGARIQTERLRSGMHAAYVLSEGDMRRAGYLDSWDIDPYGDDCVVCGDPPDYCLGHGAIGDPTGYAILQDVYGTEEYPEVQE